MHIRKIANIIFLLINHLAAAHTSPAAFFPSHRVHEAPDVGVIKFLEWKALASYDAGLELSRRQDGDGGSCDRKARCKNKKIRNPSDDTKCIRCPPLTKADPTRTICVRDNESSKDDRRKEYGEKLEEKIKEKFEKFKEKAKERIDKKKEAKSTEWEEKDKQRQDKRNQKRFRRMAVCSPAVAASIGTVAMLELADGGFSEDLFDSIDGDMLEFWPRDDIEDDWLDNALPDNESDITKEDYVKEFLVVGDAASGNAKRSIERRGTNGTDHHQATSENVRPSTEKRNIFTAIANAFRSLIRAIAASATRRAGGGGPIARATKYFSDGKTPNLKKPGESKFSRAEQKGKAKEISQNKNWKKCLRGEKPEK
jgi:hypothetical protein